MRCVGGRSPLAFATGGAPNWSQVDAEAYAATLKAFHSEPTCIVARTTSLASICGSARPLQAAGRASGGRSRTQRLKPAA
ncbi:hypothetical protein D3C71_838400 [compost metagenome]